MVTTRFKWSVILVLLFTVSIVLGAIGAGIWVNQYKSKPKVTNLVNDLQLEVHTVDDWGPATGVFQEAKFDDYQKNLVIHQDNSQPISWFLDSNQQKVSGFSYDHDLGEKKITVYVYISPEITAEQFLAEVNQNYIPALLHATEYYKPLPEFSRMSQIGYETFDYLEANNQLPVQLK